MTAVAMTACIGVATADLTLEPVDEVHFGYPYPVEVLVEDELVVVGLGYSIGFQYALYSIELMALEGPPRLHHVGSLAFSDAVVSTVLDDSRLVTVDEAEMLRVFDLSDPAAPLLIVEYALPAEPTGVSISENIVFVADGGLRLIDISDPAAPYEMAWTIPDGWWIVSILGIVGNHLYCGHPAFGNEWSGGGTYVYDIADPSNPWKTAQLPTGFPSEFVPQESGAFAIGSGGSIGRTGIDAITIADTSDARPMVVDRAGLYFGYDCCSSAMTLLGDRLLASGNHLLFALDPFDFSTIDEVNFEPSWIESMASIGPYLLVADGEYLRVFIDSTDAVIFFDGFELGDVGGWSASSAR
jgi:hypothetical protein